MTGTPLSSICTTIGSYVSLCWVNNYVKSSVSEGLGSPLSPLAIVVRLCIWSRLARLAICAVLLTSMAFCCAELAGGLLHNNSKFILGPPFNGLMTLGQVVYPNLCFILFVQCIIQDWLCSLQVVIYTTNQTVS